MWTRASVNLPRYSIESVTDPSDSANRPSQTVQLLVLHRRGSSNGIAATWAHYGALAAARTGAADVLRDDRVLRVMVVRNEVPPAFVEWVER